MFGNRSTPAPAISTAVLNRTHFLILACRPTDTSNIPERALAKWQPLEGDDHWGSTYCESCQCSVEMGTQQAIEYLKRGSDEAMILCLLHAAMAKIQIDDTSQLDILRAGA